MSLSDNDAFVLLQQYLPPGLTTWQDTTSSGAIGKMWRAIAQAVNLYGYSVLDTLRAELGGLTLSARAPDWEAVMSVAGDALATYGTIAQRRSRLVARRRESGASTTANIQAAAAAIMGYSPQILEMNRATLTALNTWPALGNSAIVANSNVNRTFAVLDQPKVSGSGAQVTFTITHIHVEHLQIALQGPTPDNVSKVWPLGTWTTDTGSVVAKSYTLASPGGFATTAIYGTWTLTVTESGGDAGTLGDCNLFVEAIGRDVIGFDGLGSEIFGWGLFYNTVPTPPLTLSAGSTADQIATLVQRWNPAHCVGAVVLDSVLQPGVMGAIPDDARAIPDMSVPQ